MVSLAADMDMLSVLLFLCCISLVSAQISDERMALLEFKKSISDPYGILTSWNNADSPNHCSWFGVSCDPNLRVSDLTIGGNFSLAPFCSIRSELSLHGFGMERNCSQINGKLGGSLSSAVGKLAQLRVLSLPFNELDGFIPVEIWGLKNLEVLDLEGNHLVGDFSSYKFHHLKKLRVLNLAYNGIFGTFPPSLSKCRGLRILNLAGNGIGDVIPGFFNSFRKLRVVNLSFNRLIGHVSNVLGCGDLEHLDLSANFLNGEIPRALGNCSHLRTLLLSGNAIDGFIPEELGKLRRLEVLDVSRNCIRGTLPASLGSCAALSILVLKNRFNNVVYPRGEGHNKDDHNSFEGSIPEAITRLPNLKIIWAPNANFSGEFPRNWGGCKSLTMVNVAQNFLRGSILGQFTECTDLLYLNLSSNRLTGRLDEDLEVPCISMFDISRNLLSGRIPTFNTNKCRHLPSITKTTNLVPPFDPSAAYMSFFSYQTVSEYPLPFSKSVPLAVHDFSQNKFSGSPSVLPIPCNLSFNDFYEERSTGKKTITPCSRFISLTREFLSDPVMQRERNKTNNHSNPHKPRNHSKSNGHILSPVEIICIAGTLSLLFLCLLLFCYTRKENPITRTESSPSPTPLSPTKTLMVFNDIGVPLTYEGILRATGNFHRRNCIGNGGFGSTYRAEVAPGKSVAVKRLTTDRGQGAPQFHAEVSTLGRIRHPNLITLIGYYASEADMFLIYNYLPGGNLDRFIRNRAFDWAVLHKIALNIASALCYLHSMCNPRVLHRDIKPSNILLDADNNAYLSDFGLSKILAASETSATTRVAGTYGYIAPEYALTGRVSDKADVYSYGVVLLELMSDKRALDISFCGQEDGFDIVKWAKMLMDQRRIKDFFTSGLWESGPQDKLEKTFYLAILCTSEVVGGRPPMRHVVRRLRKIEHPSSG